MFYCNRGASVSELLGKELVEVKVNPDNIVFITNDNKKYMMYHNQDCCESVTIESIVGDVEDLIGSPILLADESSSSGEESDYGDSFTWTFYKFATIKGYVDIRWYGYSNGYYSESVDFEEIAK